MRCEDHGLDEGERNAPLGKVAPEVAHGLRELERAVLAAHGLLLGERPGVGNQRQPRTGDAIPPGPSTRPRKSTGRAAISGGSALARD